MNVSKIIRKALMLSVVSGAAFALSLPAPAQAYPGLTQEAAQEAQEAHEAEQATQGEAPHMSSGKVLETVNSGGYTYVRLEFEEGQIWAAGPQTKVNVGDQVVLDGAMVMRDFTSSSLGHTFDSLLFARGIYPAPAQK